MADRVLDYLAALGLAIGLAGATWGTGLLRGSLYGVSPTDPTSYVIGALALMIVAAVACVAPTRRAMRVDPVIAMRGE